MLDPGTSLILCFQSLLLFIVCLFVLVQLDHSHSARMSDDSCQDGGELLSGIRIMCAQLVVYNGLQHHIGCAGALSFHLYGRVHVMCHILSYAEARRIGRQPAYYSGHG